MPFYESDFLSGKPSSQIIGVDEVGRGPLAGPVVSCAIALKTNTLKIRTLIETLKDLGVTDSKKLSKTKRRSILEFVGVNFELIKENSIFEISIGNTKLSAYINSVDNEVIDSINIREASLMAMEESVLNLKPLRQCKILVDGNVIPQKLKAFSGAEYLIKGDSRSALIALSSIIAKEYRDLMMTKFSLLYPNYGFQKHSGYPTKDHKLALEKLGPSQIHRKTFKGVKELITN